MRIVFQEAGFFGNNYHDSESECNGSVSIAVAPSGAICAGTNVTFTATPTNGGSTPSYQWKKNGTNVGTNSTTYSDNALSNGDSIRCVMTSNAACVGENPATSNALVITVTACDQVTLNLRIFIEGFYLGNDSMQPVALQCRDEHRSNSLRFHPG